MPRSDTQLAATRARNLAQGAFDALDVSTPRHWTGGTSEGLGEDIQILLAGLRHLCDRHDLDFGALDRRASVAYLEDLTPEVARRNSERLRVCCRARLLAGLVVGNDRVVDWQAAESQIEALKVEDVLANAELRRRFDDGDEIRFERMRFTLRADLNALHAAIRGEREGLALLEEGGVRVYVAQAPGAIEQQPELWNSIVRLNLGGVLKAAGFEVGGSI